MRVERCRARHLGRWLHHRRHPVLDSSYLLTQLPLGSFTTLPDTLSLAVGLGNSSYNTLSGDPVHLVTGNVYHTERDLAIKGRGLPLVFERSYNSRAAADGPLGYGWTHSFNHFLTFSDNNDNGLADAADSDGLTSSVTWTDGSVFTAPAAPTTTATTLASTPTTP